MKTPLTLIILSVSFLWLAGPSGGVFTDDLIQTGRELEDAGDIEAALDVFTRAYFLNPESHSTAFNLALLYQRMENEIETEYYLLKTLHLNPDHASACIALADLYRRSDTAENYQFACALSTLHHVLIIRPTWLSTHLRLARLFDSRNDWEHTQFHYEQFLEKSSTIPPSVAIEIGNFYQSAGNPDHAREFYNQVLSSPIDNEWSQIADEQVMRLEVEQDARHRTPRGNAFIHPDSLQLMEQGKSLFAAGNFTGAISKFTDAVQGSGTNSEAARLLGDCYRETGAIQQAVESYEIACRIDPENASARVNLGLLYMDYFGGKLNTRALSHFARALSLRPDWTELHYYRGKAFHQSNRYTDALKAYREYLRTAPEGDYAGETGEIIRNLERCVDDGTEWTDTRLALPDPMPDALPGHIRHSVNIVLSYIDRENYETALEILSDLTREHRNAELFRIKARLHLLLYDEAGALDAMTQSLKLEPDQPVILEQRGKYYLRAGNPMRARRDLERSADLGNINAGYHLARILADDGQTLQAYNRLSEFLQNKRTGIYVDQARNLHKKLMVSLAVPIVTGIAGLILVVILLMSYRNRRVQRISLKTLAEDHPPLLPELLRILSAVRHEILKHNMPLLEGIRGALGSHDYPVETIEFTLDRLRGKNTDMGLVHRLEHYIDELESLARGRNRCLSPHKCSIYNQLQSGHRQLQTLVDQLESLKNNPLESPAGTLGVIDAITDNLSPELQKEISHLVQHLSRLKITAELLEHAAMRIMNEPAFADLNSSKPEIDWFTAEPVCIQIPRFALEDLLGNLIRNAMQSSVSFQVSEPGIRIEVRVTQDPMTFIERAVIRVLDRSPEPLTTETLRSRYITAGLGLASDIAARYDGSLSVHKGFDVWTKAVSVSFRRLSNMEGHGKDAK